MSQCRLFTDDSIIYRLIEDEDDAQTLQQDLNALQQWEKDWGMSFNPTKCNMLHVSSKKKPSNYGYSLKVTPFKAVDPATYLGVDITTKLTWHKQISKVSSKGNRTLGFLKRNIKTSQRSWHIRQWYVQRSSTRQQCGALTKEHFLIL